MGASARSLFSARRASRPSLHGRRRQSTRPVADPAAASWTRSRARRRPAGFPGDQRTTVAPASPQTASRQVRSFARATAMGWRPRQRRRQAVPGPLKPRRMHPRRGRPVLSRGPAGDARGHEAAEIAMRLAGRHARALRHGRERHGSAAGRERGEKMEPRLDRLNAAAAPPSAVARVGTRGDGGVLPGRSDRFSASPRCSGDAEAIDVRRRRPAADAHEFPLST